MKMVDRSLNCVIIRDVGVGKSSLLITVHNDSFPTEYITPCAEGLLTTMELGDMYTGWLSLILWSGI